MRLATRTPGNDHTFAPVLNGRRVDGTDDMPVELGIDVATGESPFADLAVRSLLEFISRTTSGVFVIPRDGTDKVLTSTSFADGGVVTIRDIMQGNDRSCFVRANSDPVKGKYKLTTTPLFVGAKSQLSRATVSWNWCSSAYNRALALKEQHADLLEQVAQTSLAASYGIMNVTYPTAVDELQWAGHRGQKACTVSEPAARDCSASWLLDVDEMGNVRAPADGSVSLGAQKLRNCFAQGNGNGTGNSWWGYDALQVEFDKMITCYNSKKAGYLKDVRSKESKTLPVTGEIFQ
jgi:hypothetical protein